MGDWGGGRRRVPVEVFTPPPGRWEVLVLAGVSTSGKVRAGWTPIPPPTRASPHRLPAASYPSHPPKWEASKRGSSGRCPRSHREPQRPPPS